MDLLRSMTVFARIVELNGVSAAARELGMSATMAGNHLAALETRLGARLLNRTTRRQSLTEAGADYYEKCRAILRLVAEAETSAMAARSMPQGRLKVTAPLSFGAHGLAPALTPFLDANPEVSVDLVLSDRVVDLVEEGFEVAFRIGRLPPNGLVARNLRPYRMCLAASATYLERWGTPAELADLRSHRCLTSSISGEIWRLPGVNGVEAIKPDGRLRANGGQALLTGALAGAGVIFQPEVLLQADLDAGRLVRLLPGLEMPSRPMSLVYSRDRRMSAKVRAFIDFAMRTFG
jgi:DNA-binding transcriptional LysR family regulator